MTNTHHLGHCCHPVLQCTDTLENCIAHLKPISTLGEVDHDMVDLRLVSRTFRDTIDARLLVVHHTLNRKKCWDLGRLAGVRDLAMLHMVEDVPPAISTSQKLNTLVLHRCALSTVPTLPTSLRSLHLEACELPAACVLTRALHDALVTLRIVACCGHRWSLAKLGRHHPSSSPPTHLENLELNGNGAGACVWLRRASFENLRMLAIYDTRTKDVTTTRIHTNTVAFRSLKILALCGHNALQHLFMRLRNAPLTDVLLAGIHREHTLHTMLMAIPPVEELHIFNSDLRIAALNPHIITATRLVIQECHIQDHPTQLPAHFAHLAYTGRCRACGQRLHHANHPLCAPCHARHRSPQKQTWRLY
jgi:hypothetical protein